MTLFATANQIRWSPSEERYVKLINSYSSVIYLYTPIRSAPTASWVLFMNTHNLWSAHSSLLYATKTKDYSNPAGGHLTFISQWNLTNCRYNNKIMYAYTEECICINYAIGFCDVDIYDCDYSGFIVLLRPVCYMCTNTPVLELHNTGNCLRLC